MAHGISQLENRNWNIKGTISVNGTQVVDSTGAITANIKDTLATGSIYIGDNSNVTSELDIKSSGQILVGTGSTAQSVAVSGDATLASGGALSVTGLQNGAIALRLSDDNAGAVFAIQQNSSSPAVSDIVGTLELQGKDDAANTTTYAGLRGKIDSPTDGAEIGSAQIRVQNGTGSMATAATFTHDGTNAAISTGVIIGNANAGVAGTNVTAFEYGDGFNHVTVLQLAGADLGAIGGAGNLAIGALVYTFPAGAHLHSVTYGGVSFQGDAAVQADTPDFGIGSVIGTGAVAVLGGTATFEDYVNGSAASDCNGAANGIAAVGATAGILTGISLNQPADVKAVHLNAAATWSGASVALTATGSITLNWTYLGM